jgi:hypothetical protein
MATFNISTTDGPLSVKGVVVGAFAVHRSLLKNFVGDVKRGTTWTVTHLPTGHELAQFKARAHALRLASALDQPCWNDPRWEFACNTAVKRRGYYKVALNFAKHALSQFRPEDFA